MALKTHIKREAVIPPGMSLNYLVASFWNDHLSLQRDTWSIGMVGEYLEILDVDPNNTREKGVGKTNKQKNILKNLKKKKRKINK